MVGLPTRRTMGVGGSVGMAADVKSVPELVPASYMYRGNSALLRNWPFASSSDTLLMPMNQSGEGPTLAMNVARGEPQLVVTGMDWVALAPTGRMLTSIKALVAPVLALLKI